jgi:perosamine synthetase
VGRLAVNGGEPMVAPGSIETKWPIVTPEDIYAVMQAFEKGQFMGINAEENLALEREYAEYAGCKYCQTYCNGTAVLHGCVYAAGVEPGDEVLVPALTFFASATAVLHANAIPIFVDIDPVTFNIDPEDIEARITDRTKAIEVVHLHGLPCDMDEINAIARNHNLVVFEDNAHAAGAEYKGKKTGNLADMSGGSTIMGKNLPTCGEGALFTTNHETYRDRSAMLREFGELYCPGFDRMYSNPAVIGWNYRMNVINAAFTRSQLKRLDAYTRLRQENVALFNEGIGDLPAIIPPRVPADRTHAYHVYRLTVAPEIAGIDVPANRFRRALQDIICAEGLPVHYYQREPVPFLAMFQNMTGFGKGCPWTCTHSRAGIKYDYREYVNTLRVLEETLTLGFVSSPTWDRRVMKLYVDIFHKVFENVDEVVKHARELDYCPPWEEKESRNSLPR